MTFTLNLILTLPNMFDAPGADPFRAKASEASIMRGTSGSAGYLWGGEAGLNESISTKFQLCQKCKLLERRLRAYRPNTSEDECDGNDKQDAGCNRQNLDSVIVWSVAV